MFDDDDQDMDLEVMAMPKVYSLLKPLSPDERARVVAWVIGKLDIGASIPDQTTAYTQAPVSNILQTTSQVGVPTDKIEQEIPPSTGEEFDTFAELCAAADPKSDAEKALVAGYWQQVGLGQDSFTSYACNTELKHYGIVLTNVTRAFDTLKSRRPQLAVQLEKSGRSTQARKKYKITTSGIKAVEEMIRNNAHT